MYDKNNPFHAKIIERHILSKEGTQRHTYHIVLDLSGSSFKYSVGDSIGIFPINDYKAVAKVLQVLHATGDEIILERNTQNPLPLKEFLVRKANLGQFSRKLITEISARQTNLDKKAHLETMLTDAHHDALKAYQEQHHIWDLLAENTEAVFTPQELCTLLMPLLPRLYSIASAQDVVGDEVHLTVSHLLYNSNGHAREGVATSFLCQHLDLNTPQIPTYIQPHHGFTLPENPNTPIIMIGPGTGVAPFRAFMQQRTHQKASGKNWLFFGEWHRDYDFFYEEFWLSTPNLRTTTAFSRDQPHKIYVQHRMLEHGNEIYQWILEGAVIYVCGDAQRMAKDVDAALHSIIEKHGGMDNEAARKFVKKLRADKRYLRDIY